MKHVQCPYCQGWCKLHTTGYGPVWACTPCDARVGCHKGTTQPLGTPANAELRTLRMNAHAAFDPLWKRKAQRGTARKEARFAGYMWLARELKMEPNLCHIGMMGPEDCKRVIALCEPWTKRERNE